jgi:hypothetical protein
MKRLGPRVVRRCGERSGADPSATTPRGPGCDIFWIFLLFYAYSSLRARTKVHTVSTSARVSLGNVDRNMWQSVHTCEQTSCRVYIVLDIPYPPLAKHSLQAPTSL